MCCFFFPSFPVCSPLPFTLVSSVSRLIQMRKKFRLLSSSYSHWGQGLNTKLGTLPFRCQVIDTLPLLLTTLILSQILPESFEFEAERKA